jgi:hypothetical protein
MGQSFADLVTQTQQLLRSYVRNQEVATWLTSGVAQDALTFSVHEPKVLSRGLVEIGSELVLCEDIDKDSKVFTAPPFGRGMEGSVAVAHEQGARVTVNPLYPRSAVANALNQTILGLGNQLFGVDRVTFPASATRVSYELPAETEHVLGVSWFLRRTASKDVVFARDWVFDNSANWPSGKGLLLYEWPLPGDPITVTYGAPPLALTEGDQFADSGLAESVFDVVMLGAASRLIISAGTELLTSTSVGAQTTLGRDIDPNTPVSLGRYLYAQYQERLRQEIDHQQSRYQTRLHYTRRR